MPVTFNTATSHRVTMLDKDADFVLKAMKTSGNIPGALYAEDVQQALLALNEKIAVLSEAEDESEQQDCDAVGIKTKAFPLIELMERAIEQSETLLWDRG